MLYVVIGIVALVALYFLFFRKSDAPPTSLPSAPRASIPPPKPQKAEPKPAPSDSPKAEEPKAAKDAPSATPHAPAAERVSAPPPPPSSRKEAERTSRPFLSKRTDVERLRRGLARSRESGGFFGKLRNLFGAKPEISADITRDIEDVLVASDVGVKTTATILERVKNTLERGDHVDASKVWDALRGEAQRILEVGGKARALQLTAKPTVILFVGVNGAGKTTTIGKLATKLKEEGHTCVLAAGDTFRAAAVQQLAVWGTRIGCEVVRGKDGADPGSVVFEAIEKAKATGADVVLADTAGRLHTKTNLMSEMQKIARTAAKALDGAPHETLLVIDATNGQNALAQAQEFKAALPLSGIVLTKLDGTAKGGVVLGIADELELPVRFVGLGERPDDLHEFSPADFVEALLGREAEESAA